jgi:hypothetical protein
VEDVATIVVLAPGVEVTLGVEVVTPGADEVGAEVGLGIEVPTIVVARSSSRSFSFSSSRSSLSSRPRRRSSPRPGIDDVVTAGFVDVGVTTDEATTELVGVAELLGELTVVDGRSSFPPPPPPRPFSAFAGPTMRPTLTIARPTVQSRGIRVVRFMVFSSDRSPGWVSGMNQSPSDVVGLSIRPSSYPDHVRRRRKQGGGRRMTCQDRRP